MLISIIDTETTGLDPETDKVIEIAAVLVDTKLGCIVNVYSALVHSPENPAAYVNHIPQEALDLEIARKPMLEPIRAMISYSHCIVAHNADFDRPLTERLFIDQLGWKIDKPWVCSLKDIRFPQDYDGRHLSPKARGSRKLTHLAVDHGISPIFGEKAHRAVTDVMILAQLILKIDREGINSLENQVIEAQKPKEIYQAIVPPPWEDGGRGKEMAKACGFSYNASDKRWEKRMTIEEATGLPFEVRKVVI